MKITIICVGKLKEKFYREAAAEYAKRLGRYCKLEIVEVQDEKTPDQASASLEEQIKAKEAAGILKHIKEEAFLYALEIKGEQPDSLELSRQINSLMLQGKSHIQFVIGGSLGLHESVLQASDRRISFSKMTFPHQLMRVILLEQIYRSCRILSGEPYHK